MYCSGVAVRFLFPVCFAVSVLQGVLQCVLRWSCCAISFPCVCCSAFLVAVGVAVGVLQGVVQGVVQCVLQWCCSAIFFPVRVAVGVVQGVVQCVLQCVSQRCCCSSEFFFRWVLQCALQYVLQWVCCSGCGFAVRFFFLRLFSVVCVAVVLQ